MESDDIEVKASKCCPFCDGSELEFFSTEYDLVVDVAVECVRCGARGPLVDVVDGDVDEARRLAADWWDIRRSNEPLDAASESLVGG